MNETLPLQLTPPGESGADFGPMQVQADRRTGCNLAFTASPIGLDGEEAETVCLVFTRKSELSAK